MILKSNNRPRAYSYIRWSTVIQGTGDSNRRQVQMAVDYADKHGLDLVPEDIIRDEGLSGFTARNLKDGALGQFIRAVEAEKIPKGSYLLVESFDRLSRQTVDAAVELFLNIIRHDIILVTLSDQAEYRKPVDMTKLIMSIVYMSRAHEESLMKRQRGVNNWKGKRLNIGKRKLTSLCPGWLTLSDDRTKFIVNDERAAIVRRVFDLSLAGQGAFVIARKFNTEGVTTFGRSDAWGTSSVKKLLRNRAVIGEYQPCRKSREDKQRTPEGEPDPNYFPAIIEPETFHANQATLNRRRTKCGRKGKAYSNLFSGLALCHNCGSKMHFINKGEKGGTSLFCHDSQKGICPQRHGWRYKHFEKSFFSFVREIDLEAVMNGETISRIEFINGELHQLENEKRDIDAKRHKLMEGFENDEENRDIVNARMAIHNEGLARNKALVDRLSKERSEILDSRRASKEAAFAGFPTNISDEELYNLRAKAAEQISGVVESIHMVKGPVLVQLGEENDRLVQKFDSKYLVRFKGGASRLVIPDSSNAEDAFVVANMDFPAQDWDELPRATKSPWHSPIPQAAVNP
ncbi:recombinase family protein [Mesorhizobium sp. M1272]|uniref:recombinase family protein n=1 Tax=Mesorhizobium sp. M1272 TaxID=2957074 RepID=UPI003339A67E